MPRLLPVYNLILSTGVGFFLNGRVLPNNCLVLLSDIGEGSRALYCLTNREACCSYAAGGNRGLWRFPGGADVTESESADFLFTRGYSSLLLNRRNSAMGPTGIYTCLIPDARDVLHTLYFGIYNASGGKNNDYPLMWQFIVQ